MDLLQQIVARAKADKQRIVLPEAEEERTLKAADKVLADDLADIILIGNPEEIKKKGTATRQIQFTRKEFTWLSYEARGDVCIQTIITAHIIFTRSIEW